jgi:MHS family alpha-ketoglutarate permease-like MFS transporter
MTAPSSEALLATASGASQRAKNSKVIFGVGIGNAIEYFDWTVYATFVAFFAGQFFNTGDSLSNLLAGFAVFAVGFVTRPFGGLFFGWLADRKGRKQAMTLSVGLAAVGSLIIGLTPGYAVIGAFASFVLVLARMLQGVAHGGELPTAQTYIVECAPQHKRGLWSSVIYVSNTSGVVAGTIMGVILTSTLDHAAMTSWGWRVPFLIGGLAGLFVLWMRSRLDESPVYKCDEPEQTHSSETKSIWRLFRENRLQVVQILFFISGGTVFYYVWGVAAPAYAIAVRGVDSSGAFWAGLGANVLMIVSLPLWGKLSDRIGRKPLLLGSHVAVGLLAFPLNAVIGNSAVGLFVAMSLALVTFAATLAVSPAMMAELFPTGLRTAGVAVPYSIAIAIFGGTAGYVQTFFASLHSPDLFTWYLILLIVVSTITLLTIPETRNRNLNVETTGTA